MHQFQALISVSIYKFTFRKLFCMKVSYSESDQAILILNIYFDQYTFHISS